MTFVQLQNDVLARLGWSSTDARALVKSYLNQRYREVQSSCNLARTRFGTVTANTVANDNTLAFTGIAKLNTVYDAVVLKRPLQEVTVAEIREMDTAAAANGNPTHYAVLSHINDTVDLLLYPEPAAISALSADGLLAGTDMAADADEPTIPDDFHDILLIGAEADGRRKSEKRAFANDCEQKFQQRLADLRYFLLKSANLRRTPHDRYTAPGRKLWPYSNLS
jgi:hypothetical protein